MPRQDKQIHKYKTGDDCLDNGIAEKDLDILVDHRLE